MIPGPGVVSVRQQSSERLDEIEQSQRGLRDSIEETKRLSAKAHSLVERHRQPGSSEMPEHGSPGEA